LFYSSLENPTLVRYEAIREEVHISTTTRSTTSHDPDNTPPDYYQLTNKERPMSPSDVASNVSYQADTTEKKEDLSITKCTEEDQAPAVNGGIHSDAVNNNISELLSHELTSTTDKPPSTEENCVIVTTETKATDRVSSATNGEVTGVDMAAGNTLANDSPSCDNRPSPATKKKKLFGLFGVKQKPRRDSQKPLFSSQSSQTPGDR